MSTDNSPDGIISPNFKEKSSDLPANPRTAPELVAALKEAGALTEDVMGTAGMAELEKKRQMAQRAAALIAGLLERDAMEFENRGMSAMQLGHLDSGHMSFDTARALRIAAAWLSQVPAPTKGSANGS
jgi:hypothetical protein